MTDKLLAPVTYQGGKSRLASQIVETMNVPPHTEFYDLCCGSGAIALEMVNRGHSPYQVTMVDKSPWGLFWNAIGQGTFDVDEFERLCARVPKDPRQVKGYVESLYREPIGPNAVYVFLLLQASAIGGKAVWTEDDRWWRSSGFRDYWLPTATSSRRSPVNPMMPMPDTIVERVRTIAVRMRGVRGFCSTVESVASHFAEGTAYIDPPYDQTTGYGYSLDLELVLTYLKIPCWVSEGRKLSDTAVCLSHGREKGGITGERKRAPQEEWLSFISG